MTEPGTLSIDDLAALSALADGDLPAGDAALLRARIEADPRLAAAFAALQALPDALASLPLEIPPARLDEGILHGPRPAPPVAVAETLPPPEPVAAPAPWRRSSLRWFAAAAALAAAVFLVVPRPAPVVVIEAGLHRVEGRVSVLAGDHRIDVDGATEVHVEPTRPLARGRGVEVPMKRSEVLAAGFGALVTVSVIEGSAMLRGPDGEVEALRSGDTRRWGEERGVAGPGRVVQVRSDGPAAAATTPEALAGEVERLRMENALLRGQIANLTGVPQPWPAQLAALYRPEGFEARAKALLGETQGVHLARVDCDEYPCIAVYRIEDPSRPLDDVLREPLDDTYGDDANIMVWGIRSMDDNGASYSLAAVAVTPDENADDLDALRTRVNTRVEPLVDELASSEEPG